VLRLAARPASKSILTFQLADSHDAPFRIHRIWLVILTDGGVVAGLFTAADGLMPLAIARIRALAESTQLPNQRHQTRLKTHPCELNVVKRTPITIVATETSCKRESPGEPAWVPNFFLRG
jgi:hypothetical protein